MKANTMDILKLHYLLF
jgi:hypothetical protein